ncbi:MAG: vanadium-dependent haloperoxidase [Saprospiraceae bacterium]|nr:vanadium-dependent haloperoxidase [Saprospiraceae bacterium]
MKSFNFTSKLQLILSLFVIILLFSCKTDIIDDQANTELKQASDYDASALVEWNETFLEVERYAAGYRPGPAPRALAYLGMATYEGCISGMPSYKSFNGFWSGFNVPAANQDVEYCWPVVANAIYEFMMPRFFERAKPSEKQLIDVTAKRIYDKYKSQVSADVYDRSVARGKEVAQAVWAWSVTDQVGHEHYLDPFQKYDWQTAYKKEGDWIPTFPGPGKPMGGVWGQARRFAINNDLMICRPPLQYSANNSSALYAQALEVYSQNTPTLSYIAEWIGEFWSDDLVELTFSPGPRWLAIGNQVLVNEKSNLETAVLMNAKVGLALNDASVGCWNSKYHYNVERPQTYINRVIDPTWTPALYNPLTGDEGVTPSFPAYPSGHSTMGAAGAEALASIFGYSYAMTDRCHEKRTEFEGVPRSFPSFEEMALENAWSRVPLGVHFRMDCEEGVRYGKEIGRRINNLPWKK